MEIADVVGLVLFIIHILAFVAGGASGVLGPIVGPKLAGATPEQRGMLLDITHRVSTVGKYALGTLLVTGVLTLWLKWNWVVPNWWFWAKMFFVLLMLVFVSLGEIAARKVRAGDMAAGRDAARYGQFTGMAFLGVVISAVFAFN